ncbi:MAG: hypothetical protein Q8930_15900 [Bacillota bacterium]|nr:hypothetical protein [Bacillota bacterium]
MFLFINRHRIIVAIIIAIVSMIGSVGIILNTSSRVVIILALSCSAILLAAAVGLMSGDAAKAVKFAMYE